MLIPDTSREFGVHETKIGGATTVVQGQASGI